MRSRESLPDSGGSRRACGLNAQSSDGYCHLQTLPSLCRPPCAAAGRSQLSAVDRWPSDSAPARSRRALVVPTWRRQLVVLQLIRAVSTFLAANNHPPQGPCWPTRCWPPCSWEAWTAAIGSTLPGRAIVVTSPPCATWERIGRPSRSTQRTGGRRSLRWRAGGEVASQTPWIRNCRETPQRTSLASKA